MEFITQALVVVGVVVAVAAVCHALGWEGCARHRKDAALLLAIAALVFAPTLAGHLAAQNASPGFPDLVGALKATRGCLGVEAAQTASGKQVIFAWFENKQALLGWYYSDVHQQVMRQAFPNRGPHTPMADVPDDGAPILAVASVTMADKPHSALTTLPVAQIAIELYRPLAGGVALGGRFAPAGLKVPGLREIPLTGPTANDR